MNRLRPGARADPEMMLWSARHDPRVAVPGALIAELKKDRAGTAWAIRDMGGIEGFLGAL